MKKLFSLLLISMVIISSSACDLFEESNSELSVVSTIFPGYDFARAVVGDEENISVEMILEPGVEAHDYEPTPQDIITIESADVIIYVGGDSDEWIESILEDIDTSDITIIRMMDVVEVVEEEIVDGMEAEEHEDGEEEEEETEYDEHVWTSLTNSIEIINEIEETLSELYTDKEDAFSKNAESYITQIEEIDEEIKEVVETASTNTIVVADRFPFAYFTSDYNLTYYAAFPGCSSQTEASASTIAFLIDKVNEEGISSILKIELSSSNIADTISDETGAEILTFHSAHNVSSEDFENGVTYVDIMKSNVEVLKKALN